MSSSFSDFKVTVRPLLVTQYAVSVTTRHLIHPIIGTGTPDITLQESGPRSGTMAVLLATELEAVQLFGMLTGTSIITFSDDTARYVSLPLIANGTITRAPDDQNKSYWVVTFDWMEARS